MATVSGFGKTDLAAEIERIDRPGLKILTRIDKSGKIIGPYGTRSLDFETFAEIVKSNMSVPDIAIEIMTAPVERGKTNSNAVRRGRSVVKIMDSNSKPIIFCADDATVRDLVLNLRRAEIGTIAEESVWKMINYPLWRKMEHMMVGNILYKLSGQIGKDEIVALTAIAKDGQDRNKSVWVLPETTDLRILTALAEGGMGIVTPSIII